MGTKLTSKYIAFLRGINVGGNALIKMTDLAKKFEEVGLTNIKTVIASGNVIFEGDPKNLNKLPYQIVYLSYKELKEVVAKAPKNWFTSPNGKDSNIRKYIAFLIPPLKANAAAKEIKLKENVDYLDVGEKVLYLSTKLEGITKSGLRDLIKSKIYKQITLRNFNTIEKILKAVEN